ncbi:hypothetical protein DFH09DRAFT_1282710 [Mycena vulgaris]|nr:hypothetical protein DFH09DRAFT_1282710 [Mycena vulgaris]
MSRSSIGATTCPITRSRDALDSALNGCKWILGRSKISLQDLKEQYREKRQFLPSGYRSGIWNGPSAATLDIRAHKGTTEIHATYRGELLAGSPSGSRARVSVPLPLGSGSLGSLPECGFGQETVPDIRRLVHGDSSQGRLPASCALAAGPGLRRALARAGQCTLKNFLNILCVSTQFGVILGATNALDRIHEGQFRRNLARTRTATGTAAFAALDKTQDNNIAQLGRERPPRNPDTRADPAPMRCGMQLCNNVRLNPPGRKAASAPTARRTPRW